MMCEICVSDVVDCSWNSDEERVASLGKSVTGYMVMAEDVRVHNERVAYRCLSAAACPGFFFFLS